MKYLFVLLLAVLLAGCYTQLKTVHHERAAYEYDEEGYADEADNDEDIRVYQHYYPAADPYFDYLYYDDPFWYHHTRFYLGYDWYYSRWYRPLWHRPWWSWCYTCIDYYNPWYSWYYPAYYYPWGAYDPYSYVNAGFYGKRTFGRRGSVISRRDMPDREDRPTSLNRIARRSKDGTDTRKTIRSKTGTKKRDNAAVRKRGSASRAKGKSGSVTKRRSRPPSSGRSGTSIKRSAPPRSSPATKPRSGSSRSKRR